MLNEKTDTDQLVRNFIHEINITNYDEQGSSNIEIKKALKNASKSENMTGYGKPEFIFFSKDYLIVVEDKQNTNQLLFVDENNNIDINYPARKNYAVNGAIHYAKHIINKTMNYKEIIAIGVVGNSHNYIIQPYLVTENGEKELPQLKSFEDFSPENIEEFYKVAILGELPKEERELREVNKIAEQLHEDLRNYGQLEGEKKATVISAILLALEEPSFSPSSLLGSDRFEDGKMIFDAVKIYLDNSGIVPYTKVGVILDQFRFLETDVTLNTVSPKLNMTPLKYYALTLETKIIDKLKKNIDMDILGNFYGEFVKYGGNDGNSLGIVLTPRHITQLMVDLIDINQNDYVLDPCVGTGAFLISAMNTMLEQTNSEEQRTEIKRNHLFGIEIQNKLFTIATTNMILRGDGKSNLYRDNCFTIDKDYIREHHINKVIMNPPYSQAKTKENENLSELSFILNALEMMDIGGKLCAIVPQSTMVGKTKVEKEKKRMLLKNNTLDTVITLNTNTFYGVGVNPCIVIITSGIPHKDNKKVKFVNFENDGYIVRKHIGLVADGTEKGKKDHLMNVLENNEDDSSKFIVKTVVKAEDEWLHSFYYFNDEIPTDLEFEETIADYLTFQYDMFTHGKDYLFEEDV